MKISTIFFLFCVCLSYKGYSQTSIFNSGNNLNVGSQDTLHANTFFSGNIVTMMGVIDNDFFSAARQLMVSGNVTDDAFLAGQVVNITGRVGDMLMAAGENVTIDGIIDGDVYAAAREIHITQNARINGDARLAAEVIIFEGGNINGQLKATGDRLRLNGTVNNTAEFYSEHVTFGADYKAEYGTTITSKKQLHRENLGVTPANLHLIQEHTDVWGIVLFQLWFFISLLLTGCILIFLFRKTATEMLQVTTTFWKNLGIGILVLILTPIAIVLFFALVLTIPIAILLALAYGFMLFISYLLVAMTLGVQSFHYFNREIRRSTYYWALLLGMIYIAILTNIPYFGWLINLAFIFFGLGSVFNYIANSTASQKKALKT